MVGAVVRQGGVNPKPNENAAKTSAAKSREGATQTEREKNPGTVRSKSYDLRDPSTGIFLPQGKLTEIPYFSGWLCSQIDAGLVELVNGDPEIDKNRRHDLYAEKVPAAEIEPNAQSGGAVTGDEDGKAE